MMYIKRDGEEKGNLVVRATSELGKSTRTVGVEVGVPSQ